MTSWTVDNPATLDFDEVTDLEVRLTGGSVAVLASDERPSVAMTRVWGRPLTVGHTDGVLTVGYEEPAWDHLLEWLRPQLPAQTQARISLRSLSGRVRSEFAGARSGNVGGMSGNVSVTSASGAITLLRRERVESETR